MDVRHFHAGEHQTDLRRLETLLERLTHDLRDSREVGKEGWIEVQPVINFKARHDECVSGLKGTVGEEGDALLVLPDKTRRQLAGDDASKNGGYRSLPFCW